MALTKESVIDKIEVIELGQIQVRTATRVVEDGAVLSTSFHRHTVVPREHVGRIVADDLTVTNEGAWQDTDISGEDAKVKAVANAYWTDEIKTAYENAVGVI